MNHETLVQANRLISREDPKTLVTACNYILEAGGSQDRVTTPDQGEKGLYALFQSLLDTNQYVEAALLIWGEQLFNPHSRSVGLIWKGLVESNKTLVLGGAGCGKTWTAAAWVVLSWVEDPANTTIKIISTTLGHAKSNIMAKITRFHRESALKLPGFVQSNSIELGNGDKAASISQISIPEGDNGKGRLTGFHPMPRSAPHHKFGTKTRVAAYIDEADTVPYGLWEGLDNMLSSEDYQGVIKVVGLTNPRDRSNSFATRAEPTAGWGSIDPDSSDQWISKDGWLVIRLDPSKSENVVQRKDVFPGMMTYQGYANYMRKGTGNPDYWIMGRGWYPEASAEYVVVSPHYFDTARGVFTFLGDVIPVAAFDPAFAEGGDLPILTTGRVGTAIAFTPEIGDRINFHNKPLHGALQIEQQFEVKKSEDHSVMGKEVMAICTSLQVKPEWLCVDQTGNALGLASYLKMQFGTIMGLEWGSSATNKKILDEDIKTAEERFHGISTEMYFAFGDWLQYGKVKFAPIFANFQKVTNETSGRRYHFYRGFQKLETKANFKTRNESRSPDCFVAGTMISTPNGDRSIESISIGDTVCTPLGCTQVVALHESVAPVVSVGFSNGANLIGKGKHKIFTFDNGWVRLDNVSTDNKIESVRNIHLWLLLNSLFTTKEHTTFKALVSITPFEDTRQRRDFFTESCGQNTMGLFLKACSSIIRMGIGLTIESKILSSCHTRNITDIIDNLKRKKLARQGRRDGSRPSRQQEHGMGLQKATHGMSQTARTDGKIELKLNAPASVEKTSNAGKLSQESIAQVPVGKRLLVLAIWLIGLAKYVARCFVSISTEKLKHARASAARPLAGERGVYNLTLLEHNAYYANGVLVQNCADSLVMLVHLVRMRRAENPQMLPNHPQAVARNLGGEFAWKGIPTGVIDRLEFVDDV